MVRPWAGFTASLMMLTGAGYDAARFILFIATAALPVLIYSIAVFISKMISPDLNFKELFAGFAYTIIPLGLMMFIGFGASVAAGRNISKRMFQKESVFLPFLLFAFIFFVFYLWVLGQPIMHKH